ncbi:MAG: AraC family transcriptional regulator ligand-binding domain-containing protein [Calditrichia bacterium]
MAFTGRFIANIAHFASKQGANLNELIALSGRSLEELCAENCFIEDAVYNSVIELAVERTGDDFFGLHAGENMNLAAAGLIAQISQTSETVKQALEYCCQFANLGCSALPMQLLEEVKTYKLTMTPQRLWREQSPLAVRHTAEGMLAFTIREFHALLLQQHYPLKIHLPWERPPSTLELERVLACPIKYEQNDIAVFFEKAHIESKIVTSDFNLLRILVAHAEEKSAQLAQELGFTAQVKQSVIALVKPAFPTIEQVAGHLNLSPRTLQRRLQDEGATYKQLLNDLRMEFAVGYLKRPELSIGEIAYLLSYADTSSFTRSFKRWIGKSPKDYRQSLL